MNSISSRIEEIKKEISRLEVDIATLDSEISILNDALDIISLMENQGEEIDSKTSVLKIDSKNAAGFTHSFKYIPGLFYIKKTNYSACLYLEKGKYILKSGSGINMSLDIDKGRKALRSLRETALKMNYLVQKKTGIYETRVNFSFDSPSAAAVFVMGGLRNGWIEWINSDGKTLEEMYNGSSDNEIKPVEQSELVDLEISESGIQTNNTNNIYGIMPTEKLLRNDELVIDSDSFVKPEKYNLHGFYLKNDFYECPAYSQLVINLLSILDKTDSSVLDKKRKSNSYRGKTSFISKYTFFMGNPVEYNDGIFVEQGERPEASISWAKKLMDMYNRPHKELRFVVKERSR